MSDITIRVENLSKMYPSTEFIPSEAEGLRAGPSTGFIPSEAEGFRAGPSTQFIPSEAEGLRTGRIGSRVQRHDTTSATLSAGLRDALMAGLRAPLERLRRNLQFVIRG